MAFQAQETNSEADSKPFIKQYKLFHASFAQFCYTGAQVAIASFFINYAVETRPGTTDSDGAKFFAGAQAGFAVGRFFGSFLMKYYKPRMIFFVFLTMCIVFIGPPIVHHQDAGVAFLYVVLFFESICFPTIVALGMRGLGRHTKRGSGFIVAGVVGGACVPPLTGAVADKHGIGICLVVPMMFFVAAWSYPICVNFVPNYKKVVDSFYEADIGLNGRTLDEEKIQGGVEEKETATTIA